MLPGPITPRYFRYALLLLVLAVLAWSGWQPKDRFTWFLEVAPILAGVPVLIGTFHRFPLTPLVYRLLFVHALILMLGVGLIGGAVIGLPLLIVGAPAFAGFISGTAEAIRNGMLVSGVLFFIYLPILLLLSGILRAYTTSAWTLTYIRLTTTPALEMSEVPDLPEGIEPPLT